ncbi:MAG: fumarylacetoacetate hydrolase family protein [Aggregatilineaceae bacterium]
MSDPLLVRFHLPGSGPRVGVRLGDTVHDVSRHVSSVGAWLRASAGRVPDAIAELRRAALQAPTTFDAADLALAPAQDRPCWLAPVDDQEVWAAGVTYERSRVARQAEAIDGGDIYARVYIAERPELFFKAQGWRVVGPGGVVGIRADSRWTVPEPELAVVLNPALEVVGFTVGNDMSSRDIEGANPLYLPQAKVYTGACALGPGLALTPAATWPQTTIRLTIWREGAVAYAGEVHTARIHRTLDELIGYLGRSNSFPDGVVLLTGTGIVPPDDFTLQAGDEVEIAIDSIGTLRNPVGVV